MGEIKTESDSLMKAGVNGGGNRYYISYAHKSQIMESRKCRFTTWRGFFSIVFSSTISLICCWSYKDLGFDMEKK